MRSWSWILALLALALACRSGGTRAEVLEEGTWSEADLTAASDRVLWQVTLLALEKSGFTPGSQTLPADLIAHSNWRTSLAPFKGDGFRQQVIVRHERLGQGRYHSAVRVRRERNDDLDDPLDPKRAKWVEEDDDEESARLVLQYIRSLLGQGEIDVGPLPSTRIGRPGGG